MQLQHLSKLLVAIVVFSSIACINFVYASTNVVNNISISSNSGGNVAKNGETIKGKSESFADITTIINGEIVEDVHKTSKGESVYIEHTVVSNNGSATTSTHLDMQNASGSDVVAHKKKNDDAKKASTTIISNTDVVKKTNTSLFAQITTSIFKKIIYALSKLFKFQ